MDEKTIVVLGGGIGGIVAARELRRHLGKQHRIIIIEKSAVHSLPSSYLWVMLGWRAPEAIQKPLSLLNKHGIEIQNTTVREIEINKNRVKTDSSTVPYDYLVIALGADIAPHDLQGISGPLHTFYTLDGAKRLHSSLQTFSGGRIAIVVSQFPHKCPPAPYEAALLLESFFSRKDSPPSEKPQVECRIELYTPEPFPLAATGSTVGQAVTTLLEQRDIGYHPAHTIRSIDAEKKHLLFENNVREDFNLCIVVPPHAAPEVVRASGLADATGWIPVDARSMQTRHPNVFALGDVSSILLPHGGALPKIGGIAQNEAEVIAHNIACEILQHGMKKEFAGTGFYFLETGLGKAGYLHAKFFETPSPKAEFREPSVTYHWAKVVAEKYWLWRWF